MSSREDRNYYTHLFSSNSDSSTSLGILSDNAKDSYCTLFSSDSDDTADAHLNHGNRSSCNTFSTNVQKSSNLSTEDPSCQIDNLNQILRDLDNHVASDNGDLNIDTTDDFLPDSLNLNISTEDFDSVTSSDDISSTSSESSSLEFLSEEEMIRLLEDDSEDQIKIRAQHYSDPCLRSETLDAPISITENHIDRIGTFNIQNQYDHSLAAKLFLEGEFTFLSFQEPFATQTSINDAWGACRRFELNSARIACFETHHQVIMFDNWKWGGKIIDNFNNLLNGRIASIAFGFENQQSLGIISLYGIAMGSTDKEQLQRKNDLRRTIIFAVKKLCKQWKKKFPNINIMILGDMQETLSTSDFDNLGQCRYELDKEVSLLQSFQSSHTSIVRDRTPATSKYLTRFGTEGARGIDHILFPRNISAQSLVNKAIIDDKIGLRHFPSDHKLLSCSICRQGSNNAEIGDIATRFAFRDIFQIRMKRTGTDGDDLAFDTSQFKDCSKYRDQLTLFKKVQELSGDSSEATNFHLNDIEKSITSLYSSLWKDGEKQGINGQENKLVKISERHAAELAAIANRLDLGIKDTMTFLQLSSESDCMGQMARTRKNISKTGNFKLFANLPVSTKLRYIRTRIKEKKRRLKRYSLGIAEMELKQRLSADYSSIRDGLLKDWNITLNARDLCDKAKDTHALILKEMEERSNHIQAMRPYDKSKSSVNKDVIAFQNGNDLQHVSEATVKLINHWLTNSNCNQCFNRSKSKNSFEFLVNTLESWTSELQSIQTNSIDWDCADSVHALKNSISNATTSLSKLEAKLGQAQRVYKSNTLEYLLKVNKIEDFTRKVQPKSREAPATHTEIWDACLKKFRPCRNENEELAATANYHGTWMGNSKAEENCAFAHLDHQGLLGIRGVHLTPDRKVTMKDIPKLIHNGNNLKHKDKLAFIAAHGSHTSNLFRPPQQDNPELYYPFFLEAENGTMHRDSEVAEMFWKAIASTPGKARYDGFQMAVLGRFGKRWQRCLLNLCKLVLIMRYIPKKFKAIARFPIPKPGRVNEYRPISLCHDIYCFINSISTHFSSQGILAAQILHDGIAAYVKGKGCAMLVGVEQGVREDCLESGIPTSQTDEDEEKFFDRIPVEILLAAMRVNGFPTQGFVELKASGMGAKTVEIITVKGTAHARFECGLEQGNPDSPTIANLVIKFKHDIWKDILQEIQINSKNSQNSDKIGKKSSTRIFYKHAKNKDAYQFHITDKADGKVSVDRIGYCDDNTRYTSSMKEEDVIFATTKYIQRAGDLSLVTKIGRKGSKSEIQYYNLKAATALKLKKIDSFAWSFTADGPVYEKVPFKVQLQHDEMKNAYTLAKFHEMSEEDQNEFLTIFQPVAQRHLGLKSTLSGDTSSASKEVLDKIKFRMKSVNLSRLDHEAQQLCSNMLCSSVHSYAPLQMRHKLEDLLDCDKDLVKHVMKRKGLSQTDAKHGIFLEEHRGGYGFNSFLEIDIVSNARELEIALNGSMIDSEVIRARAAAFLIRLNRPEEIMFHNYTGDAILKLAKYGIHLRDTNDGLINFILNFYNSQASLKSIGDPKYSAPKSFSIGLGKDSNKKIAFGSQFHGFLKRALTKDGDVKANLIIPDDLSPRITKQKLKKLVRRYKFQHFQDTANTFNFWEWRNLSKNIAETAGPSSALEEWTFVDVAHQIQQKYPTTFWQLSMEEIQREAKLISNIETRHKDLISILRNSDSTPFIATDGSHREDKQATSGDHSTTSAAVLCLPNVGKDETLKDQKWINRRAIPLLARIARLPLTYGAHNSDIAHGEATALCIGAEMLQNHQPKILITDSAAIRSVAISIRDREAKDGRNRVYIRKLVSGISKHLGGRMENNFIEMEDSLVQQNLRDSDAISKFDDCLSIAEEWIGKEEVKTDETQKNKQWSRKYFDKHDSSPIFKVDSHQLDKGGRKIKTEPRYATMVPNLFALSCNHFADVAAELAHSSSFKTNKDITSFQSPTSKLRFAFTWNGLTIDKHISDFLYNKFQEEKLLHLISKNTQGLPWRIIPDSTTSWSDLLKSGGLFRSLRGLTRTHSRSIYKSHLYRKGWMEDEIARGKCLSSSSADWTKFLTPCRWCDNPTNSKGNRMHAFFFCRHKLISDFRDNMSQLLEQQLKKLLDYIEETQNKFAARLFTQDIELTLQKLHGISGDSSKHLHVYRTGLEWMKEEGIDSWKDLLQSNVPVYSAIFGFIPITEGGIPEDKSLTLAHGIPLGVMPKQVEGCLLKLSRNIYKYHPDKKICDDIREKYMCIWEMIKEINVARAVGLHRIIGGISKDYEKDFKSKYGLEDNSYKGFKKAISPQQPKCGKRSMYILKKRKSNGTVGIPTEVKRKKKRVKFEISEMPMKYCIGITCNHLFPLWNDSKKRPNSIRDNQKHCLRCSKQCTAINKSTKILESCISSPCQKRKQDLIDHFDSTANKLEPKKTFKKIKETIREKNQPTIKTPCTDAEKLIANTIVKCIARKTNRDTSSDDRFKTAFKHLTDFSSKTNTLLKNDLKTHAKLRKEISSDKSYNQKNKGVQVVGKNGIPTITETILVSNAFQRMQRTSTIQVAGFNQLVGGDAVTLAVISLRAMAPAQVFIGNAESSSSLRRCNSNKDWLKFATCFGNKDTINKPHGIYLIPIFSGDNRGGHWSLAIIEKKQNSCNGWVVDSLGYGCGRGEEAQKIKMLFSSARKSCTWRDTQSVRQTENECGPRTIDSMARICEALGNGEEIGAAIALAMGAHETEERMYNSMFIRNRILHLLRVSSHDETTHNENIREMRKAFRHALRNRSSRRRSTPMNTFLIDLC